MRAWIILGFVVVAGGTALWAGGQNAAPSEEAAVKAAAAAYATAMEKGDLPAIFNTWSADADYLDDMGKSYRGREAIGTLLKQSLDGLKDKKVAVTLQAVRFLKPDIALTDGAIEVTPKDGPTYRNRFTAVWMKNGGVWQITSARDLPDSGDLGETQLKAFEWLIGDWEAKDKDVSIKLSCRWALSRKFMQQEFAVKGSKEDFTVVQMIGWDPVDGTIRSWMFDSRGGFGDGTWEQHGNVWEGNTAGVLPSAQTGSARCVLKAAGTNGFVWSSTNRDVDGAPIPDHELKYTRVGGAQ